MLENSFLIMTLIAIITIISLLLVYSWWENKQIEVDDEEFKSIKVKLNPSSSNKCPLCGATMNLSSTQRVIFINNQPVICCLVHTSRELTDYIKQKEANTNG